MLNFKSRTPLVSSALKHHFGTSDLHTLVTSTREFPLTARSDLQNSITEVLCGPLKPARTLGLHSAVQFSTITFSRLSSIGRGESVVIAPLQYDEVDVGNRMPARCLRNALWLCAENHLPFAVLLTRIEKIGQGTGLHLEVAVPPGEPGLDLTQRLMDQLERHIARAASYRGKVLSLEASRQFGGEVQGVRVHRLRAVRREEVILPEKTLSLLERNIFRFIEQRDRLKDMQLGIKKGLLFYGPPGTGKTHTIRYLATQMPDHTSLLITAGQIALLEQYIQLARFLQPAMLVIEDVDLIARTRNNMRSGCEESMLNQLLNEMDGLREDAKVLFVLTTNHPEQLERALTSRPGRIDQAIEFPLPDDDGRRKLIQLYAGGLTLNEDLLVLLVQKTKGASGAFIKELMRRSAQFLAESDEKNLSESHVKSALDEMLFSGGTLNAKLLGFSRVGFTPEA
jgi:energy-coupling factor transporter ATP-binding protein EcfA2